MKPRLLSFMLVVVVLCACMTVTAYATETEAVQQQFINVLEFATPNNSGNYYVTTAEGGGVTAGFQLPYGTQVRYIDMLVSAESGLSTAWFSVAGNATQLTLEAVSGNTCYRIYGEYSGGYASYFEVAFVSSKGGQKIQFQSLRISSQALSVWGSPSTFLVEDESVTQNYGDSLVTLSANFSDTLGGPFWDWTSSVRNGDWAKYDYMTFTLSYNSHSINNISVQIGGNPVPFEINEIDTPPSFSAYIRENALGEISSIYSVNVTVDLTGVNRTQDAELIVTIQGIGTFVHGSLHHSTGYTVAELPDAELTWLQRIWKGLHDGFNRVVDAITGDTAAADQFQDDVTDKTDELGGIAGAMDSVDTPDEFDPQIPDIGDMGTFVEGGGLSYVMGSPYILPLFTASMVLCFVSYALYGKKG